MTMSDIGRLNNNNNNKVQIKGTNKCEFKKWDMLEELMTLIFKNITLN